jgi:hypothetical protein
MTNLSNSSRAWLSAAGVAVFVAFVIAFPALLGGVTNREPANAAAIPPAFYGNRAAFGLALFSLFSMSALSIRKLILLATQLRDEPWRENPDVGLYRIALALLLSVVVLVAAPDVLVMLIYGEASPTSLAVVRTGAFIADGLALPVFGAAFLVLIRVEQLERMPEMELEEFLRAKSLSRSQQTFYLVLPRRDGIADHVRIVAFIFVIALGLALYK